MNEGEVKDVSDLSLVNDLISAGLVESTEKAKEKPKTTRKRSAKK